MKHIKAIDGLRAWMAWWVVCQHLLQISGMSQLHDNVAVRFLTMGGLAVMVFAIISGFVIANLQITKREPYGRYIARRFLRIYPLYAIAILLALCLREAYFETIAQTPWAPASITARLAAEDATLPAHIALHTVLLHGIVPNAVLESASMAILAPAWSLSLEWQYYLIAPPLIAALFSVRPALRMASFVACLVAITGTYFWGSATQWEYPAFLPLVLGFFVLGAGTRMFLEGIDRSTLILPAIIVTVNLVLYCESYTGGHLVVALIPVLLWAVTILYCVKREAPGIFASLFRVFDRLLNSAAASNLGLWSYSTYLLHMPLFVATLWTARRLGLPITQNAYFLVLLLASAVLIGLSRWSFLLIEKRVMRWGVRIMDTIGKERLEGSQQ